MNARIPNPAMANPATLKALIALAESTGDTGVPTTTHYLMHVRASQINGCSGCLEMHTKELREAGESDERIFTVAAWRDTAYFTDAERAALALAEALTRIADRADPVDDEVWNEVARHYDEKQLSSLVLSIAAINTWNRLNVATRQIAGAA
ncbi:carboxymuconolactone decarboxylase family protein [Amycolatopsis regifaucium]|uniref:Alkylhydroperoxidase n=1 Tax=Amycolatopsis regifaucium TaxID=546365 RepID=A0A154MPD7_9PSEU|nr:carboxymuconolactone decarboxylase family protein [Amycolatopsis regifaucium]KZB86172.1 alkylhydroperoxidase [Amycolatopsis regifaucium]OKA05063.1 alkylhydroperoxidase [Amycolatopsis regifaucium]SFH80639.1 alkylhydroperoxidase AhpD family core domain-containing protein [Amycolatopsis regifaucium]